MWPLPPINNKHFQVILHQQRITFAHIESTQTPRAHLKIHEVYEAAIGTQKLMYNPKVLHDYILSFLNKNKLHYSYLNFVLGPDLVEERIVQYPTSHATLHDLLGQLEKNNHYYMDYIGSRGDHFLFYVCIAAHSLMLQLQLINMQLPIHIQRLSPPMSVQCALYKHLHGSSFNQSQLALDIDIQNVRIPSVFSSEFLHRRLKTHCPVTDNDHDLLYALGSFFGVET